MGGPGFILQHVVDAFAVQHANEDGPAIGVVFGLVWYICQPLKSNFQAPSPSRSQDTRTCDAKLAESLFPTIAAK